VDPRPSRSSHPGRAARRAALLAATLVVAAAPVVAAPPTDAEVRQVIGEAAAIRGIAEMTPIPWAVATREVALERQLADLDADARAALAAAGLGADVRYQDVPAGDANDQRVISQGTDPSTQVAAGAVVRLTVGRAVAAPTP